MCKNICYKGRQQAEATGKRLQELGLPYSLIVQSTIVRAKETAKIIEKYLKDITVKEDSVLSEGMPIAPDPPINIWNSEVVVSMLYYYENFYFFIHYIIILYYTS